MAKQKIPDYRPGRWMSAAFVARDYRRWARWQLKEARADEAFVRRLLTGTPEPGREIQPWMLRKHPKSSPLVKKYQRKAANLRKLAAQALARARYYEGVRTLEPCRLHADCRKSPEMAIACAREKVCQLDERRVGR